MKPVEPNGLKDRCFFCDHSPVFPGQVRRKAG